MDCISLLMRCNSKLLHSKDRTFFIPADPAQGRDTSLLCRDK
jgi:hypothetical protein